MTALNQTDKDSNLTGDLDLNRINNGFKQLARIDLNTKLLVYGYLREQTHKLFAEELQHSSYFNLHALVTLILIYSDKQRIDVKITILGDSQTGKTSLLVKYIEDTFDKEYLPTLNINRMEKQFELKNCIATLQIYDLGVGGGQYNVLQNMPSAMKRTKSVIFVFNLINKRSVISIKRWYKDARKLNKIFKPVLVGAKYDLFKQKDDTYKSEIIAIAREYAQKMHSSLIFCSSAKAIHIRQVYTLVIGSVFQIKIKSKQKSDHDGPILEYDVIYTKQKKRKKKRKK